MPSGPARLRRRCRARTSPTATAEQHMRRLPSSAVAAAMRRRARRQRRRAPSRAALRRCAGACVAAVTVAATLTGATPATVDPSQLQPWRDRGSRGDSRNSRGRQASMTTGTIIGRRRVRSLTKRPAAAPDVALQRLDVVTGSASANASAPPRRTSSAHSSSRSSASGAYTHPRVMISGPVMIAPDSRVDRRRPPRRRPPRRAPGGRAARPGRRRRRCRRRTGSRRAPCSPRGQAVVGQHQLVAVLADEHAAPPATPIVPRPAGRGSVEVAVLAVHRGEPLGPGDRQERLQLLLLGVAAWRARRRCRSARPRRRAAPGRRSPCDTFASLPGIGCELRITVSSGPSLSHRFSLAAISDSADIGSPCDPVEMTHTRPGSRSPTSSMSTQVRVGDAQQAHLAGQAHVLLHRHAERRDGAAERDGGVGDLLDPVDVAGEAGDDDPPALVARGTGRRAPCRPPSPTARVAGLVGVGRVREQQPDARVLSAMAPMRARSVSRPSTGVRSSLKSPECRIVPCGVWKAVANPWGTECVTGMNSTSNGPIRRRSPSCDRDQLGAVEQARLLDAVAGQPERERRAVDREATARAAGTTGRRRGPRGRGWRCSRRCGRRCSRS